MLDIFKNQVTLDEYSLIKRDGGRIHVLAIKNCDVQVNSRLYPDEGYFTCVSLRFVTNDNKTYFINKCGTFESDANRTEFTRNTTTELRKLARDIGFWILE